MAALTADRNTPRKDGVLFERPVGANKKIYAGALVVLNGGYAEPGTTATGLVADGRAEAQVDNTGGAAGAKTVPVRKGVFRFNNSAAADAITAAEIGTDCYIVDDNTVAKTDGGTTRSKAGRVVDVDAQGVWVEIK